MSVASVSSEASGTAWVMSEDQRVELIDATESDPSWNRRPVRKRLGAPYIRFLARRAEGVAGRPNVHPRASYGRLQEIVTLTFD